MTFEWDEKKNHSNFHKHGLPFEEAQLVFDDPLQVTLLDRVVANETRWRTLGKVDGVVIILVIHTLRSHGGEPITRIISARRASKKERRVYEKTQLQS